MLLYSIWQHKSIWVLWFERKHPNGHPRPRRSSLDWESFTSKKPLCSKSFPGWRQDEADWREVNWWGERLQRRGDFPFVTITHFLVFPPYIPSPFLGLHPEKCLMIFESPGTAVVISCSFHIMYLPNVRCLSLIWADGLRLERWAPQEGFMLFSPLDQRICHALDKVEPNNIVFEYEIRLKS